MVVSPIRVAHEVAYNGLTLELAVETVAASPQGVAPLMRSCLQADPTARPTFALLVASLDALTLPGGGGDSAGGRGDGKGGSGEGAEGGGEGASGGGEGVGGGGDGIQ